MSAAEALSAARAVGVRFAIDGDDLVLEASAQPPVGVLKLLVRNKAGVIALLRSAKDAWSAADWLAFYDERVGIAEFELPRDQAEVRAFDCCVAEWLGRRPVPSPPGRCLACGAVEQTNDVLMAFGTQAAGHAWLHLRCSHEWRAARKAEAGAALAAMGISKPRIEK